MQWLSPLACSSVVDTASALCAANRTQQALSQSNADNGWALVQCTCFAPNHCQHCTSNIDCLMSTLCPSSQMGTFGHIHDNTSHRSTTGKTTYHICINCSKLSVSHHNSASAVLLSGSLRHLTHRLVLLPVWLLAGPSHSTAQPGSHHRCSPCLTQ
jgi:hypothetical protein